MNHLKPKQQAGGRAGFTLMEVLIAMAVFAISFLGFYRLQMLSVGGNANAARVTTAAVFASDAIERIRALDYDDPLLDDDGRNGRAGLDDVGDEVADETMVSSDGLYSISWNVAEEYPLRNVKTIRIRVVKMNGSAEDKMVVFDYYKSKY